jgi:transcriptional regulator with XRE-family HTH domain
VGATGSHTARRRELGSMLRTLRERADLTTEQVAERLEVSRSKISRLENGQRGAGQDDIRRLSDLYQVDDEQRIRLAELAAEGKQRAWWSPFSLPHSDYFGLEAEASSISDWGLALVPGLLQTSDYARAVVRAGMSAQEPRIIEERVQARMGRQALLSSDKAPIFEALLDESVLYRVVGSPAIMAAQLRRLLEMSQRSNISIRVVPYDAGVVPAGVTKFIIMRFAPSNLADVVLIEDLTSHRYLKAPEQVEAYSAAFRTLASLSADPATSQAMIRSRFLSYEVTC